MLIHTCLREAASDNSRRGANIKQVEIPANSRYNSADAKYMNRRSLLLLPFAVLIAGLISVPAQNAEFADPNVEYGFDIPDAKWKMTVKPSATMPNVEYVFVDRNDGHLEVPV